MPLVTTYLKSKKSSMSDGILILVIIEVTAINIVTIIT